MEKITRSPGKEERHEYYDHPDWERYSETHFRESQVQEQNQYGVSSRNNNIQINHDPTLVMSNPANNPTLVTSTPGNQYQGTYTNNYR